MSDPAIEAMRESDPRPRGLGNAPATIAVTGIVSGLLCASVVLAPFCLIPAQIVYGRGGRRAGLLTCLASVLSAVVTQTIRLAAAGALSFAGFAASFVPALVFFGALALVNAVFWSKFSATYRVLAVAAVCALASIPALASTWRDQAFIGEFESRLDEAITPLRAQLTSQAGDGGYDASALIATFDSKSIAAMVMKVLSYSYTAILVLVLGGSVWFGNRAAGPGSQGREVSPALASYRAPYALLWAFLASWTAVLVLSILVEAPEFARAFAWNCALSSSLAYAAQGAGIAASLFIRWNVPRFMRFALVATAVIALATPTASIVVAVGLPLLGVTEVWIPYRNPKGVGA